MYYVWLLLHEHSRFTCSREISWAPAICQFVLKGLGHQSEQKRDIFGLASQILQTEINPVKGREVAPWPHMMEEFDKSGTIEKVFWGNGAGAEIWGLWRVKWGWRGACGIVEHAEPLRPYDEGRGWCPRKGGSHSIFWAPQTYIERKLRKQALAYMGHGKSEGQEMLNIWE